LSGSGAKPAAHQKRSQQRQPSIDQLRRTGKGLPLLASVFGWAAGLAPLPLKKPKNSPRYNRRLRISQVSSIFSGAV